jgi:hypothetical protein
VVPDDVVAVSVSGAQTNGWYTATPTVTVTNSSAGHSVIVRIDNGAEQTLTSPAHPAVTGDGVHTVTYRSSTFAAQQRTIAIDTRAPTVAVRTPAAGTPTFTVGQTVLADFDCSDVSLVSCTGAPADGAALDTATPTTGTTTRQLSVTGTDAVGRSVTVTRAYKVAAPSTAFSTSIAGSKSTVGGVDYYTSNPTDVTITSSAGGPLTVKVDNAAARTFSSASTVVHLTTDGTHTLTFSSHGKSGSLVVKLDLKAPTIAITSPGTKPLVLDAPTTAQFTCTDAMSGVTGCTGSPAKDAALNTATWTTSGVKRSLVVTATDAVGHTAKVTRNYTVHFADGSPCDGATSHRVTPASTTVPATTPRQLAISFVVCNASGVPVGAPRLASVKAPHDASSNAAAKGDTAFHWNTTTHRWEFRHDTTGLAKGTHVFKVSLPDATTMSYTLQIT